MAETPRRKKAPTKTAQLAEASDPQTPPARLAELLHSTAHGDVQLVIVGNPNTPIETLRGVVHRFPKEVERNTAWALAALADPSLWALTQVPRARSSRDPDELLELARTNHLEVRRTVAGNRSTPVEALWLLSQCEDRSISEELARHPQAPPELLSKLASGAPPFSLQELLLKHPSTPTEELRRLVDAQPTEKEERALSAVVQNPAAPGDLLTEAALLPALRSAVAKHPRTPRGVLVGLIEDTDPNVRAEVASNPSTPPEELDNLAHAHPAVRLRVAENPSCSTPTLQWLVHDPQTSASVRQAVANHRNTPLMLRQQLGSSQTRRY